MYKKREDLELAQRAANKMIRHQFTGDPHNRLMCAIIERAILDLTPDTKNWMSHNRAATFLNGPIKPAVLCGLEPEWVRKVIRKCGIPLKIIIDPRPRE